jgi:hypothetical protein
MTFCLWYYMVSIFCKVLEHLKQILQKSWKLQSLLPTPWHQKARSDSGRVGGPSYMSLTRSAKARLDSCNAVVEETAIWGHAVLQKGGTLFTRLRKQRRLRYFSRFKDWTTLKGRSMTRSLEKENENWFFSISQHTSDQCKLNSSLLVLVTVHFIGDIGQTTAKNTESENAI